MTVNWRTPQRIHERFVYRLVDRDTWREGSELTQVSGGSVELSSLTDLKATASLSFNGSSVPEGDMVRIYYGFADDHGESVLKPIATLMFSVSEPTFDGMTVQGKMDCQSVLAKLAARNYGSPFTVAAGSQAIQKAIGLVESLGLRVNNPDPSAYTIKEDHTFAARDADYLTITNWLLESAGYSAAWVDEYGIVQFTPYVEPSERPVTVRLDDMSDSILLPEVTRRSDYRDTPNVVRLTYEDDSMSLYAYAANVDSESRLSLDARGYEITHQEDISELDGDTASQKLEALKAMAKTMLVEKSSDIEYVDGSCLLHDSLAPNAAVEIDYARAGMSWRGAITNVSISLDLGAVSAFSARRFVRTGFMTDVGGGVLWEVSDDE